MAENNTRSDAGADGSNASREALRLEDVLTGVVPEGADAGMLGAYLTFETVGNNTVICVDSDGAGPAAPVPILTLANVTGKTLQDLLNEIPAGG